MAVLLDFQCSLCLCAPEYPADNTRNCVTGLPLTLLCSEVIFPASRIKGTMAAVLCFGMNKKRGGALQLSSQTSNCAVCLQLHPWRRLCCGLHSKQHSCIPICCAFPWRFSVASRSLPATWHINASHSAPSFFSHHALPWLLSGS